MRRVDISTTVRPFPCILLDDHDEGLLRRAHRIVRHATGQDSRSKKVDVRKARQRIVAIRKRAGLDRTMGCTY